LTVALETITSERDRGIGVVLVTDIFPPAVGGSGELLANVYRRLAPVPVRVLTTGRESERIESKEFEIVREPLRSFSWGVVSPGGLGQHYRRIAILRELVRDRPAVVHCGRGLPEGLAAYWLRIFGGPPYVCWAHGEEIGYVRESRELRALFSLVIRRAAHLLANSANTARELSTFGVRPDRIAVVYPGVDAERFQPRPASPRNGHDEVVLLTVGRLQKRKGHDQVIRALARLGGRLGLRYIVVGDGAERQALAHLARDCGVEHLVTFTGAVTPEELPRWYASADIFVHPNRVEGADFEGFGIVFLEAAASGLPVIAGASGGAPEAVADGSTGVLVSGTDTDELARAIERLATDADLRRRMGEAGRRWILASFSWGRAAEQVLRIHNQVGSQVNDS
jgi:phosphatidylinositol alpha-1,6-mannosyltransferase